MPLLASNAAPVHLVLSKDRVKTLKSGHPWVYAESVAVKPPAPSGSLALIKTKDGDIIAKVCAASPVSYETRNRNL
jgi:23S rRNA (cytosine1962-C5)-methyltransferase